MSETYKLNIAVEGSEGPSICLLFEEVDVVDGEQFVACRIPLCMFEDLTASYELKAVEKK